MFFRHFHDNGASYLARTWLVSQEVEAAPRPLAKSRRTREPWNGHDWYVSFGEESGRRVWQDARSYGFVSAGGGEWYSRSLRNLPLGARVFVCIPKSGYVGIGRVTGSVARFSDAVVTVDGQQEQLAELSLAGTYLHNERGDTDETAEYVVPVQWEATVPASQAIWKRGLFANQNSACKLSNQFTIDSVAAALNVPAEA